jgi:hypothetical protein
MHCLLSIGFMQAWPVPQHSCGLLHSRQEAKTHERFQYSVVVAADPGQLSLDRHDANTCR